MGAIGATLLTEADRLMFVNTAGGVTAAVFAGGDELADIEELVALDEAETSAVSEGSRSATEGAVAESRGIETDGAVVSRSLASGVDAGT